MYGRFQMEQPRGQSFINERQEAGVQAAARGYRRSATECFTTYVWAHAISGKSRSKWPTTPAKPFKPCPKGKPKDSAKILNLVLIKGGLIYNPDFTLTCRKLGTWASGKMPPCSGKQDLGTSNVVSVVGCLTICSRKEEEVFLIS